MLFTCGSTSGSTNNGGFGIGSVEEHLRGLGLPIVVFADIRVDERKWPWPWMLGGCADNVVIIDIPQTEDGTVDVEFLKTQLGKQL